MWFEPSLLRIFFTKRSFRLTFELLRHEILSNQVADLQQKGLAIGTNKVKLTVYDFKETPLNLPNAVRSSC